jgi:hypothetical protein
MRKFILTTQVEDTDRMDTYYIKHPQKPTDDELRKFLIENVWEEHYDKENDYLYEMPFDLEEIFDDNYKTIPR